MKVRILTACHSENTALAADTLVELPEKQAKDLIALGAADGSDEAIKHMEDEGFKVINLPGDRGPANPTVPQTSQSLSKQEQIDNANAQAETRAQQSGTFRDKPLTPTPANPTSNRVR